MKKFLAEIDGEQKFLNDTLKNRALLKQYNGRVVAENVPGDDERAQMEKGLDPRKPIADALPYVGGMAGGVLAAEANPLMAAGAAHLGGDLGEAGRLAIYRSMGLPTPQGMGMVNDIVGAGNTQALNEVGGRAVGGLLKKGSRMFGRTLLDKGMVVTDALQKRFPGVNFTDLAEANPGINTRADATTARKLATEKTNAALDAEAPKLVMPAKPQISKPGFVIPGKPGSYVKPTLGTPAQVVQEGSAPGPAFTLASTPEVRKSASLGTPGIVVQKGAAPAPGFVMAATPTTVNPGELHGPLGQRLFGDPNQGDSFFNIPPHTVHGTAETLSPPPSLVPGHPSHVEPTAYPPVSSSGRYVLGPMTPGRPEVIVGGTPPTPGGVMFPERPELSGPLTPGTPRVTVGGTPPTPGHNIPATPDIFGPAQVVSPATPAVYSGTPITAENLVGHVKNLLGELGGASTNKTRDVGQINDFLQNFLQEHEGEIMSPRNVARKVRFANNASRTALQQPAQGIDALAVSSNDALGNKSLGSGANQFLKDNINGYASGQQAKQDAIALGHAIRRSGGNVPINGADVAGSTLGGVMGAHFGQPGIAAGGLGGFYATHIARSLLNNPTLNMSAGHALTNPQLLQMLMQAGTQGTRLGQYYWQHQGDNQ